MSTQIAVRLPDDVVAFLDREVGEIVRPAEQRSRYALSNARSAARSPPATPRPSRPVVILTRELVRPHLTRVTVAPITGTIRGLSTGVTVGTENGLQQTSIVICDNIITIPGDAISRQIGYLLPHQELPLFQVIRAAFDLQ